MTEQLDRTFFARPVLEVAPDLLGMVVEHGAVSVRLTEVEAYAGTLDPGSHAFRGPTPRNQVMFGPPGHLYCYFSYGMHWAANVVTGEDGLASGVLLRAGEVVEGVELARERRESGRRTPVMARDLARGPGNLARALGLGQEQYAADVCSGGAAVRFLRPRGDAGAQVHRLHQGPRVGVSGAGGSGELFPWRFWLEDEPSVSAYRPATRRLSR